MQRILQSPLLPALNLQHSTEHGQAWVRLLGASAYLSVQMLLATLLHADFAREALPSASVYAAFGYLWTWVVARGMWSPAARIRATTVLDHSIFALGFVTGPEGWMLAIWAPIFATIGYGLRFGARAAYVSQAVGCVVIGAAMASSSYWHTHATIGFGFVASLLILPQYAIKLSAAIAQERAEAQSRAQALENLAHSDALTNTLNRLGFEQALNAQLDRDLAGALLYLDLDGFKAVNDLAGHAAGDHMLKDVSAAMKRVLRATDHIGRLGGDEFAVVLPMASLHDACSVGEKLLEVIREQRVIGHDTLRVGASIGITAFPHPGAARAVDLMAIADSQMYSAKRGGKNQICFAIVAPAS